MMNIQKRLLIISLFLVSYGLVFSLMNYDKNKQIDRILESKLENLKFSYRQGLDRFKVIAENIYASLQNDEKFVNIFEKAVLATADEKDIWREKLYAHYKSEFEKLQLLEVMQVHFILPDNRSFLRMYHPEIYADDLSEVRYSVKYANEHQMFISGFEEGKTSHGFRDVFPIYKNGTHLGVVDVSFSSTLLQSYTMRTNDIHTHFIVNKNVFKTQEWEGNSDEPYFASIEHKDFLFSMSNHVNHERMNISKETIIEPRSEVINKKIALGEEFALYKDLNSTTMIVSFLPIKNIKLDKTVAYLVSYTICDHITKIKQEFKVVAIGIFLLFILLFLLAYKVMAHSYSLKQELQLDGLTKIFNRKYFLSIAEKEFAKLRESNDNFCIVMGDIDYFKKVNDTYGHQSGDMVLIEIASLMSASLRADDLVARYGGEEFICLIFTNEKNSYKIVDNMRKKIQEYDFCYENNLRVTMSFGIAQYKNDKSLQDIIKRADTALYKSKNSGRNCVTLL